MDPGWSPLRSTNRWMVHDGSMFCSSELPEADRSAELMAGTPLMFRNLSFLRSD